MSENGFINGEQAAAFRAPSSVVAENEGGPDLDLLPEGLIAHSVAHVQTLSTAGETNYGVFGDPDILKHEVFVPKIRVEPMGSTFGHATKPRERGFGE